MIPSFNDLSQRNDGLDPVATELGQDDIRRRVEALGDWFHNINLKGVWTAPNHFLGNYPMVKWQRFVDRIPADLTGKTVLDIGCNGGFYSLEMKRRGAQRVLAIDIDPKYLTQARFAAEVCQADIEFRQLSVYDVDQLGEQFDFVLFMGVLYHLRHPLLALDKLASIVRERLIYQTMIRGSTREANIPADFDFWDEDRFKEPDFPCAYFIENRYAGDPSNWWIPNRPAAEAMLRSAGFDILDHPESEVWICQPRRAQSESREGQTLTEVKE